MKIDKVLNAYEVSQMLGISRPTLQRKSPKELPYFRINDRGDRRYHLHDVQKFIKERTVR
jgi:hypothetical protein